MEAEQRQEHGITSRITSTAESNSLPHREPIAISARRQLKADRHDDAEG